MKKFIFLTFLLICSTFVSISDAEAIGFKNPFNKKNNQKQEEKKTEAPSVELSTDNSSEDDNVLMAKAVYLELEGDQVEYLQDKNIYITKGMSTAKIVDQKALLEADNIEYDGNTQKINATGNVKINRDGIISEGEKFNFDVTSNKYLLTDPKTMLTGAVLSARQAESGVSSGDIEYTKGSIDLDDPIKVVHGFGVDKIPPTFYSSQMKRKVLLPGSWEDIPKGRDYKISASKIVYDASKTLKNLTFYNPRLKVRHFSIPLGSKLTTTVSKDPLVVTRPIVVPILGTKGGLGGFAVGPNFSRNINDHSVASFGPFVQVGDSFGIGAQLGYYRKNTKAEIAYGSARDRFVGEFSHKIKDKTELRAAVNQFLDGGFLGSTLSKYNVGIIDKRGYNNSFLRKYTESGVLFRSEANWTEGDGDVTPDRLRTLQKKSAEDLDGLEKSAYKLEEQISLTTRPLFMIGTEYNNVALRLRTRNALRAYSTGDFQGIFTGGPLLDTVLGPLSFELGFNQSYTQGKSPLFYDQYIEGTQSIALDGDIKISEYLTLGGYTTYNLQDSELVQRQIRAKIGPKDFKLLVNLDSLRQQVQFGVNFLFGRPIDFERFLVVNSAKGK